MSKPEFATNRDGERVADALKDHIGWVLDTWKKDFEVAIASPYFNAGGFSLIADELERVGSVRLLLGVDPDEPDRRLRKLDPTATPAAAKTAHLRDALSGHARTLEEDRNLLGFDAEADTRARRLVDWLRSGRVEVRRYELGFLHGKAFIVTTDNEGVIAGSSNFTYAGLSMNRELNLGRYEEHVVGLVRDWFEELWSDSDPYDLGALYEARFEPHNPHLIYLRMLLERYGGEIEDEAEDAGRAVSLTTFQNDGVWRARRILDRRNGVLVADGVGLGKTFIAGELIREAVRERRQRVLVVAPAALRDGPWAKFLLDLGVNVEVVSFEELGADDRLSEDGGRSVLRYGIDEYAMVVIDEAHAYRHPETDRAGVLRRLLQGSPPKRLVLLTATPVNNGLMDLYYLLSYFVRNDAAFADAGITSLREHFKEAVGLEPDDLSPERLFDVLDAVAVRRTRHFVKRYYPNDTIEIDGEKRTITFPRPRVRTVEYDLEAALPGFFDRFAELLGGEVEAGANGGSGAAPTTEGLSFARYTPSAYLEAGETESFELNAAGLLRTGLLKRFESSSHAFALTCRRMAASHDHFLGLITEGHVATGAALAEWAATDSDEIEDFESRLAEDLRPAADYRLDELRADVERDRDVLIGLAEEAEKVTREDDPKLVRLCDELAQLAKEADDEALDAEDARNKRKVVVFTYYADTVDWVRGHLEKALEGRNDLAPYRGRMSSVTGDDDNKSRVLQRFAPVSSEAPSDVADEYDLLVSTDVIAEGVNLQQARHIINYDLPWNPMRLVQRHGRIDRIGSKHDEVFIRCFLPDRQIDALLGLEELLHRKIKQAAAAVGVEAEVLPGSQVSDQTFTEKRDEIAKLREEEATIFEEGGETGSAYSGEEYRQELRAGLQNPALEERMRALPWGSGSGKSAPVTRPGFVFCARVGDHHTPQFRYVALEDGEPEVVSDTLACLAHAHADEDTVRVLDEATHQLAYDAWSIARSDIYERWRYATDPSNLAPTVPKAMRDAAQLVRSNPPSGLGQAEVDALLDALEAPYGERFQRPFRTAMREHAESPMAAVEEIQALVAELGLEATEPPQPLPLIEEADVNLVCWMAVTPQSQTGEQ